jgi:protein-S-isoprenylcysteine O-methyltransferase Ste14
MSTETSCFRLVAWVLACYGVIAILLFGGAGTLSWPEAWYFILFQSCFSLIMMFWLREFSPELLKERMTFWKETSRPWDKAIIISFYVGFVVLFVLPGLDAVRYKWSHMSLALKFFGFAGILLASVFTTWVLMVNPYASPRVEIQSERGHKVITIGPYEYVRHPMYAGVILWLFSVPLALGSWKTLIPAAILALVLVIRTYLEDKTLREELSGYTDYANTVKCRLVPRVW